MDSTPHFLADVRPIPPLMTREAFAAAVGLEAGVVIAQCERGYWPVITIGKRVLVNVEAIRVLAAQKAKEFVL